MKRMKLAAAALNQTPIAWEQNCQNILSAIAQAKAQQVDLLCLPELCISGYGCEDAFMSQGVLATSLELLVEDLIPHTQGIAVAFGLPMRIAGSNFATDPCCGLCTILCSQTEFSWGWPAL